MSQDLYVEVYNPSDGTYSNALTEKGLSYYESLKDLKKAAPDTMSILESEGYIVNTSNGFMMTRKGGEFFEVARSIKRASMPLTKIFTGMQKMASGMNTFSKEMDKFGASMENLGNYGKIKDGDENSKNSKHSKYYKYNHGKWKKRYRKF